MFPGKDGIKMNGIKIGKLMLGVCQTNCYYIFKENTANSEGLQPVIVVDPADRGEYVFDNLKQRGFQVAAILLTHGHADHIAGVEELKKLAEVKVYACAEEADVLADTRLNLAGMFGMSCRIIPDVLLRDEEKCQIAGLDFRVIHTPGHTEGSCSYYFEEGGILISGDTLFEGSVGRTDFPTGSMGVLVRSIKQKLFVLPDKTLVYPGHGGSTTIGWEKENNPFVM